MIAGENEFAQGHGADRRTCDDASAGHRARDGRARPRGARHIERLITADAHGARSRRAGTGSRAEGVVEAARQPDHGGGGRGGGRLRRLAGLALVPGEPGGAGERALRDADAKRRRRTTPRRCATPPARWSRAIRARSMHRWARWSPPRYYFDRNDLKCAKAQLQWVIERAPSEDFKDLARLRLAAVLLDEKAYDEALKTARGEARAPPTRRSTPRCAATCWSRRTRPRTRRAAYKLALEKAGGAGQRVPRKRAHAARRARAADAQSLALVAAALGRRGLRARRAAPSRPSCTRLEQAAGGARAVVGAHRLRATASCSLRRWWATAVFAAARDGTVVRLDAAPRAGERWRVTLEKKLSAGVGARAAHRRGRDRGRRSLRALDSANGKQRWRARVSSEVLAPPTLANGLVLVRSVDNRIFAFGEEDGKRRWVYQRAPASLVVRSPSGVTIVGDIAYAGFSGGKLAAIALSNGAVRWESTVALPRAPPSSSASPTWSASRWCRAARSAPRPTRAASRASRWRAAARCGRASSPRSPASSVDARYAFVSDDRGSVHALDRTNGRLGLEAGQARLPPALACPRRSGNVVAVGDLEGYVHFLVARHGRVRRALFDAAAARCAPRRSPLPSSLLIQTQDGTLVALAL